MSDNFDSPPIKSASQFYHSQMQYHPSGVSTPPPPGLQYYMPQPYPQAYAHYSTNTLPQAFVSNFQSLSLEDPNNQYMPMPAYYPSYVMGYPQMQAYPPQPVMNPYYAPPLQSQPQPQPQSLINNSPNKKRKTPSKPSQFRPQPTSFIGHDHDHGEHNADNEDMIISLIREFEEHENNIEIIKGKVSGLALTQTGSRFLQKQLTKASPSFVSFILQEVLTFIEQQFRSKQVCLILWSIAMLTIFAKDYYQVALHLNEFASSNKYLS